MLRLRCRQRGGGYYENRLQFIAPPLLLWMPAAEVRESIEAALPRPVKGHVAFTNDSTAEEWVLPLNSAIGAAVDAALR